jgi:prevent-host-death family protein
MKTWQLQEAKAHLSEVVREATAGHPQEITLRGEPAAIVLSKAQYIELLKPKLSFLKFMRSSPLVGVELDIERITDFPRDLGDL